MRVRLVGLCGTDLELLRGYYQFQGVPGHEFVAQVESAPDRPEWEGARVTADINWGCGACSVCATGDPRHCLDRNVIGVRGAAGALADYVLAPLANIRPVPASLTDEEAVFTEPLAAALEPASQISLSKETNLLVLGDGKLGLLCALGLRKFVPGLVLAGRRRRNLDIAASQGVETLLVGDRPPHVNDLPGGVLVDVVIDATGRPHGLDWAMDVVRPEGTVVMKTTIAAPATVNMAKAVVKEITLVGSRCGSLQQALARLQDDDMDPLLLIDAVYPLADFSKALAHAGRPGALKVLVDCLDHHKDADQEIA